MIHSKMVNRKIRQIWKDTVQIIALVHLFILFFMSPLLGLALSIYIAFWTPYYPLLLLYIIWIYIDRNTSTYESRRVKFLSNSMLWKYFRNYFPQKLVKTADLPNSSNYIFCIFPHGMLCSGAFAHFVSDSEDFNRMFPGIDVSCHTLKLNFLIPFSREHALFMGFHTASKEAILYQLSKPGGQAVGLVIGGSAEAMKSYPGVYRLVLKNRKGFVKLALTTGTPLVPIFNFGEVDTYGHMIFPENSIVYKIQEKIRKITGVAPVFLFGRRFLPILPRKVPVTTVVGKPIPLEKVENPTPELVDEIHQKFINELTALFDEHKHKYLKNPETTFLSIE